MKLRLLAPLALFPAALFAAEVPLPDFNSNRIGVPPLSLKEAEKRLRPFDLTSPLLAPSKENWSPPAPSVSNRVARVSGMPVMEPDASVEYKMRVKTPDPDTDYKVVVKEPGIENVK